MNIKGDKDGSKCSDNETGYSNYQFRQFHEILLSLGVVLLEMIYQAYVKGSHPKQGHRSQESYSLFVLCKKDDTG